MKSENPPPRSMPSPKAADADHVGAASGLNSAVARIGGLIATELLGFVFADHGSPAALLGRTHAAALAGAAIAAIAGACALIMIRPNPGEKPRVDEGA